MDTVVDGVSRGLRNLRRTRNMTLAALAARAGLTDGYLSNVENGVTTPSLRTLATLATALETDMSAFFPAAPRPSVHVYRASEKSRTRLARGGENYTVVSARSADSTSTGLLGRIDPAGSPRAYSGSGERLLLVLDGEVEVRVGVTGHRLGRGETLHYACRPGHRLEVISGEPAVILWVLTPPVL